MTSFFIPAERGKFPVCDRCQASDWNLLEHRVVETDFIDFYECAVCTRKMSWSYRNPAEALG